MHRRAETFTEAVVLELHDTALRALSGARLAAYVGSELRGQLLARDVSLIVRDGPARGTAQKRFDVKPRRFLGEKLEVPAEIPSPAPGFSPLRGELHYARGEPSAAVEISYAGTVVAENVRELAGVDIPDDPWIGREVIGASSMRSRLTSAGRRGCGSDERETDDRAFRLTFARTFGRLPHPRTPRALRTDDSPSLPAARHIATIVFVLPTRLRCSSSAGARRSQVRSGTSAGISLEQACAFTASRASRGWQFCAV